MTIRGYKSIAYDRPVTLNLRDVSILLGANGAGKSNIVGFFKMLGYMMSRKFASYVEMAGTSNSLLHYGPKRTPVLSGELLFAYGKSTDSYSFTLANAAPDRLVITDEQVSWGGKDGERNPYKVQLEPNFKESALAESKDRVARSIYYMLSFCKVYQFHPQFDDFYLEPMNGYVSLRWRDRSASDYVFNSCQLSAGGDDKGCFTSRAGDYCNTEQGFGGSF